MDLTYDRFARIIGAVYLGLILVCGYVACVPPPPSLSPAGVSAYQRLRVQRGLDLIRDTVDDGARATPPVFSRETDVKVARWHRAVITTIHASAGGWKPTVIMALDQLAASLPSPERVQLEVYVTAAKAILAEVP